MYTIYKITNNVNDKVYIGQTIKTLQQRWSHHLCLAKQGSTLYFHKAICKYGKDSFKTEQISLTENKDAANAVECFFIKHFNAMDNRYGYNLTEGGDGVSGLSFESREKISNAARKQIWTEERCKKISLAKKGVKLSEEHKLAIGKANKGKIVSLEDRQKRSDCTKTYWQRLKGEKEINESTISEGN